MRKLCNFDVLQLENCDISVRMTKETKVTLSSLRIQYSMSVVLSYAAAYSIMSLILHHAKCSTSSVICSQARCNNTGSFAFYTVIDQNSLYESRTVS